MYPIYWSWRSLSRSWLPALPKGDHHEDAYCQDKCRSRDAQPQPVAEKIALIEAPILVREVATVVPVIAAPASIDAAPVVTKELALVLLTGPACIVVFAFDEGGEDHVEASSDRLAREEVPDEEQPVLHGLEGPRVGVLQGTTEAAHQRLKTLDVNVIDAEVLLGIGRGVQVVDRDDDPSLRRFRADDEDLDDGRALLFSGDIPGPVGPDGRRRLFSSRLQKHSLDL